MAVNPGQELSSINFSNMIGSPLRAVIEAQAESALSTVNFIKAVGFKQEAARIRRRAIRAIRSTSPSNTRRSCRRISRPLQLRLPDGGGLWTRTCGRQSLDG